VPLRHEALQRSLVAFYVSQFDVLMLAQRRFWGQVLEACLFREAGLGEQGVAGEAGTTVALELRLVSCLFGVSLFCEKKFETGEIRVLYLWDGSRKWRTNTAEGIHINL
jgi:hypothetical protein